MDRAIRKFRCRQALSAVVLLAGALAYGQIPARSTSPPKNLEDALHQMSERAGVIFAGQVISVRGPGGGSVGSGVVEVKFHVDRAVRGCTAGVPYILREWAGLWTGGNQRYRVGQRLLMLLHAPGPSSMSSPVGGMDGVIPLHGDIPSSPAAGNLPSQPAVADLRWVGTRLLHPIAFRVKPLRPLGPSTMQIPFLVGPSQVEVTRESVGGADIPVAAMAAGGDGGGASVPAQEASVDTVIGMLTSQQRTQYADR